MSRESIVFLLGIVVFIAPSLGLPETWKFYILSGSGLLLMILGYLLRRSSYLRTIETETGERVTDSFVESQPETLSNVTRSI